MNRILKIVGYAVMLFLVYIGSTSLLKSCKGANDGETVVEEDEYGEYSSDEEIYDEFFESEVEDINQEGQAAANDIAEEVSGEYDEDFSFEASEKEKKKINTPPKRSAPAKKTSSAPAKKATTTPARKITSSASYASSTGGNFLVVAGSYLIKDNADKMVKKLKGLGFNGAEVVNFDESQYHSISAGRYSTYDEAGRISKSLKNKGIDCYVHTRK